MRENKKSRKQLIKEGSRPFRRQVADERQRKKILQAFRDQVEQMAADRPSYVTHFFEVWDIAERNVSAIAEQMLQHQSAGLTKDCWELLLNPYGFIQLFLFARLMNHLSVDEEERYREVCARLDAAWQKFFAFARGRHPQGAELFDRLEAARKAAQDAVVPLFTGEASPVLTPAWANAYDTLARGYGELAEVLRK